MWAPLAVERQGGLFRHRLRRTEGKVRLRQPGRELHRRCGSRGTYTPRHQRTPLCLGGLQPDSRMRRSGHLRSHSAGPLQAARHDLRGNLRPHCGPVCPQGHARGPRIHHLARHHRGDPQAHLRGKGFTVGKDLHLPSPPSGSIPAISSTRPRTPPRSWGAAHPPVRNTPRPSTKRFSRRPYSPSQLPGKRR